jgi:hypothetical protein
MIKVSIVKSSQVTNEAQFPSQEAAQAWLDYHEGMKSFGEPARTVQQQVELSPAVLNEDGSVLQEAVTEMQEVHIPGSYQVEILDITSQLEQEAINAEARAYLASTDWMIVRFAETGVAVPQSVLDARAAARVSIV